MDFEDGVLVRLADPTTRDGVLDQDALACVAAAGYDHPELEGPYTAVFDDLQLAVDLTSPALVEGTWQPVGEARPVEVRLNLTGLPDASAPALTALWRGCVIARVVPADARVSSSTVVPLDLPTVDDAVVAALGSLPGTPDALEAARREQVRLLISARAGTPVLTDDAELTRWLELAGAASVQDWLGPAAHGRVPTYLRLAFEPGDPQPQPRVLPVTVAILARDTPSSLARLLAESAQVRRRLAASGAVPVPDPALRQRFSVVIGWVLPAMVFDDPAWPGGGTGTAAQQRAARRATAAQWLAERGIALATVETP
jgi:hypothetical protein